MKKRFFLVTALVLLLLASGFAEGTTWTNPDDLLTGFYPVPQSMLSSVSSGIYYDEVDTIILSPAELSNYSGYTIFTAYGNYEYDYSGATIYALGATVNPFVFGTISNAETANYKFGATGEIFGFRSGVIGGFNLKTTGNLSGDTKYENDSSTTVDAGTIGTADYTYTIAENYTDYTSQGNFKFGAGVDLEFIGASLYGSFTNNLRTLGGDYTYTRPMTSDTASPDDDDTVTSAIVTYGNNEDGKPRLEPDSSYLNWILGARGHLPLEIADISMPVKVSLNFGSQNSGAASVLDPKATATITATKIALITDPAETSTITVVYGVANPVTPTLLNPTSGTLLGGDAVYDETAFRALASSIEAGGDAIDPENYSELNFQTGFQAVIDPEIVVSDVFSLQTRGQLGYQFGVTNTNNATIRSVVYSEAENVDEASIYSFSQTVSAPTTAFENILDIEVGGLMDLHNRDNTLSVSTGLFYHPTMTFTSNTAKDSVTKIKESWNDATNVDAEAAAWADRVNIGYAPGEFQGTYSSTTTKTYTDGKTGSTSEYENNFYIPSSTRIVFANKKLELVGGYLLQHVKTTTVTKTYTNNFTSDTVESLANSEGTAIAEPVVTDSAAVLANGTTVTKADTTTSPGTWAGQMSFMLRWNAMENLTVDFFGQSIMDALNFAGILSINPATFIERLGMSVTISME